MRNNGKSRNSAGKLLELITRKFEIAELNLHAMATEINAVHNKMDGLNRTIVETMSAPSVETALSSLPNWRSKITQQKKGYEQELGRLAEQKEACRDAVESALRQKKALAAYVNRRRRQKE